MNTNKISPDDPRLTAFALGEMEPAERAEFALLLNEDAAALALVEEIRSTAHALGSALEFEPAPAAKAVAPAIPAAPARRKILRFPQLYFMVSGLAAACFAVFFIVWQERRPPPDERSYLEVKLAKDQPANATPAEAAQDVVTMPVPLELPPAKNEKETNPPTEPQVALPLPSSADAGQGNTTTTAQVIEPSQGEMSAAAPAAGGKVARLDDADKPVQLAPFTVEANEDSGYKASNTLAGARVRTEVKDIGSSMSALTAKDLPGASPGKEQTGGNVGIAAATLGTRGFTSDGDSETWRKRDIGSREFDTEEYSPLTETPFTTVARHPLSTFSIDVDTASYANVRRFLARKQRPPHDAVRIEEMVNYFPYHYAPPPPDGAPFAANFEVAAAPWAPAHRLVRIGLKGREVSEAARPASNLVFLIDVSGSMAEPNKLPLVKQSMKMLVERLRADDHVAIVTYAGESGIALSSTAVKKKSRILKAIDRLEAGGSTNGGAGIRMAYDLARANFVTGGVNRVILATDGDFNVGVTSPDDLTRLVADKAKSGVYLTVLGFGMGNYKDATLVKLADQGNGNYAYVDTAAEARKALIEQTAATLLAIARDVKIQVEFNPATVQSYRLIGYEKRMLRAGDFNNDAVDAGEIGAGHTVTALYEIVPASETASPGSIDPLKYQKESVVEVPRSATSDELLTVKIRYKEPSGEASSKVAFPLRDSGHQFDEATPDFKFSAAVAAFGMILRDSPNRGEASLGDVESWARAGIVDDTGGYRAEFIELVRQAAEASP